MTHPILQAAYERRDASRRQMESLIDAAEARGGGSFTDVEARTFERHAKAVRKDDAAIVTLEADAARSEMAASASAELTRGSGVAGAFHTSGNMTYGRDGSNSFLRDLVTIATSSNSLGYTSEHDHRGALDRMATHRREIDIEARNNPRLAATLAEIRVNPNTSDGSGGEFVPPTWLVNQYIPLARASRVIANRMRREPLPTGTDSINLPKIKTGTATAIQTAQANAVQSTDATTSTVTATVNTIAGQQDISVQLIDQSPIDMTNVIFEDLSADYDQKLDVQIISGSGTGGQHLGIFAQSAASANTSTSLNTDQTKMNAVTCASPTFFDGATTSFSQYRSVLNAITNIQSLRYASPTAIYVHPRRANSWSYAADSSSGRPLWVRYGAFNAVGEQVGALAEGVVGELAGLPVIQDANVPILCATGSLSGGTGDMIGVVRESDMLLYEGEMRMRVLAEVLSGTLMVRCQVYSYSAFFPHRYPPSTTLITGSTGLAAAAF